MGETTRIDNAWIVNEGQMFNANLYIKNGLIYNIDPLSKKRVATTVINAADLLLFPGAIDDQVHFREPGLTQKGDLYTESRAAVAGGITSYMEMPNTFPSATNLEKLEQKYARAAEVSIANYSFYMGTTNANIEEIKKVDPKRHCGIKIFMGSSTGDMLVDDPAALEAIFKYAPTIITTHCESDPMIKQHAQALRAEFGEAIPMRYHAEIRNDEACYVSSELAITLAKKHDARLHILHISTEKEIALFSSEPLSGKKKITAEACVHHLWFTDEDYDKLGWRIKWNPAIKKASDRAAIRAAVQSGKIDVLATDHAPHTFTEKQQGYFQCPSGGPLVQHAIPALLDLVVTGVFSYPLIVEKYCHNPALLFQIANRGYIREGYAADIAIIQKQAHTVTDQNTLYKCGWTPFHNHTFTHKVVTTLVNGNIVWHNNKIHEGAVGQRLNFNR